jgi:nitrate reductase beta subunit
MMKIRAQIGMVLNLDKCIGCHTCSVTCKNVWTSREGVEYAWFNNVETKPGVGYPKEWENQDKWNGGWTRKPTAKFIPKGRPLADFSQNFWQSRSCRKSTIITSPSRLITTIYRKRRRSKTMPTARPRSLITGERMEKIHWGPNWEEILGTEFEHRRKKDYNFKDIEEEMYGEFENTFMMYLPRLCEHCLNPTCVASCPSGSIYKREEDGIVLVDQDTSAAAGACASPAVHTKKFITTGNPGKAEKCTFCYPRIENGEPTVCSETCVGRIRYLGVILYDADRIEEAASVENPEDLYEAQLGTFLNPHDPEVIKQARKDGIPENWIEGAQQSPVYKMAMEWKVAFPLHPEYRTLPMVWYIPPLSPVQVGRAGRGNSYQGWHHAGSRRYANSGEISRQSA